MPEAIDIDERLQKAQDALDTIHDALNELRKTLTTMSLSPSLENYVALVKEAKKWVDQGHHRPIPAQNLQSAIDAFKALGKSTPKTEALTSLQKSFDTIVRNAEQHLTAMEINATIANLTVPRFIDREVRIAAHTFVKHHTTSMIDCIDRIIPRPQGVFLRRGC